MDTSTWPPSARVDTRASGKHRRHRPGTRSATQGKKSSASSNLICGTPGSVHSRLAKKSQPREACELLPLVIRPQRPRRGQQAALQSRAAEPAVDRTPARGPAHWRNAGHRGTRRLPSQPACGSASAGGLPARRLCPRGFGSGQGQLARPTSVPGPPPLDNAPYRYRGPGGEGMRHVATVAQAVRGVPPLSLCPALSRQRSRSSVLHLPQTVRPRLCHGAVKLTTHPPPHEYSVGRGGGNKVGEGGYWTEGGSGGRRGAEQSSVTHVPLVLGAAQPPNDDGCPFPRSSPPPSPVNPCDRMSPTSGCMYHDVALPAARCLCSRNDAKAAQHTTAVRSSTHPHRPPSARTPVRCTTPPSRHSAAAGRGPTVALWHTTTSRSLNTPGPLTLRRERRSCSALTLNSEGGRQQPEHAVHAAAWPRHVDVPRPVGLRLSCCYDTTRAAATTAARAVAYRHCHRRPGPRLGAPRRNHNGETGMLRRCRRRHAGAGTRAGPGLVRPGHPATAISQMADA